MSKLVTAAHIVVIVRK